MSDLLSSVTSMNQEEQELFLKRLELKKFQLESAKNAKESFGSFVKTIWLDFIEGAHHKIISKKLEAIRDKKITRLIPETKIKLNHVRNVNKVCPKSG